MNYLPWVIDTTPGESGSPDLCQGTDDYKVFGVIYNITWRQHKLATGVLFFRHFDPWDFVMLEQFPGREEQLGSREIPWHLSIPHEWSMTYPPPQSSQKTHWVKANMFF